MTIKHSGVVRVASCGAAASATAACAAFVFSTLTPFSSSAEPTPRPDAAVHADVQQSPGKLHQVFDIIREGDKIGVDTIDVEKQNDVTTVKTTTKISVKVMYIEAYRFDHSASETWKNGQLVAFKSRTDDNGTKHAVDISPGSTPDKFALSVDGVKKDVPKTIAPASLWSKDIVTRTDLFDPADGKLFTIKAKDLGEESVTLNGGVKRQAHHYKVADKTPGEFDRDLWYAGDLLVRMKLVGSDRSIIVSDLR